MLGDMTVARREVICATFKGVGTVELAHTPEIPARPYRLSVIHQRDKDEHSVVVDRPFARRSDAISLYCRWWTSFSEAFQVLNPHTEANPT